MSQRTKVVGARAPMVWLLIFVVLVVIAALAVGGLVIYPQFQEQREEQARQDEAEQHYQAGVAFQNVGELEAAKGEYMQVISLDAAYKDVQARLAEVKGHLAESMATATAATIAQVEQEQASARATAVAAQVTAAAVPTTTAEALESRYQRALALVNLQQWVEAQAELRVVFDGDPDYKDVQSQLALVNAEVARSTPTATPAPLTTPTNIPTPSMYIVHMYDIDDEVTLYIDDKPAYKAKWGHYGVEPDWRSFGHKPGDSGEIDITSMLQSGTNSLRFELWNKAVCCGTALSIQVKQDDQIIFSDAFRQSDSSSGIKYNRTLAIKIP